MHRFAESISNAAQSTRISPRADRGEQFSVFETLEQPLLVKTEKRSPRSRPVAGGIRRTNSSRPGDCWSPRTLRAHHWL